MKDLPYYIDVLFILTTLLTLWFFYKAANRSLTAIVVLLIWLALQALVTRMDFYTVADTVPPRFMLVILPPLLLIISLFFIPAGRRFIRSFDQEYLTLLHSVRIPVECVLYLLFLNKKVPERMTFEGLNLDILSGVSALLVWYFGYKRKLLSATVLLVWNIVCLGLLFNIVYQALFSAPFVFQKYAFDRPNVAVLYFPYSWLPALVVPLVFFAHVVCIYQIVTGKSEPAKIKAV